MWTLASRTVLVFTGCLTTCGSFARTYTTRSSTRRPTRVKRILSAAWGPKDELLGAAAPPNALGTKRATCPTSTASDLRTTPCRRTQCSFLRSFRYSLFSCLTPKQSVGSPNTPCELKPCGDRSRASRKRVSDTPVEPPFSGCEPMIFTFRHVLFGSEKPNRVLGVSGSSSRIRWKDHTLTGNPQRSWTIQRFPLQTRSHTINGGA